MTPLRNPRPSSRFPRVVSGLLLFLGLHLAPPPSAAAQLPEADEAGRVEGVIVDGETGQLIRGAHVRVREVGRADFSHADGTFHLENLRPGEHTLVVQMLGYATTERVVTVEGGRTTELRIELAVSALSLAGIVVTGIGRERGIADTYRPTSVLAGDELDRRLSWSLAETLRHQPGISAQSFGPAPAQPIIRGMGGDRVLVLEDGQRTGDLYSTGPDHAVGVDPISASRIEVVRGPAGLLYGSNALGGVINVIREEVPRQMPEGVRGTLGLSGASVNRGATAAGNVLVPIGLSYALRGEVSARAGGDLRTPLGELPATDSRGINASLGASWIPTWGFVGVSYRAYLLDHGIPGEFQGEQIPGAHEGGVDAETRRQVGRFQLGRFGGLGPFSALQVEGNLTHYVHREIEGVLESGDRVIGTSFDQITATAGAALSHEHTPGFLRTEGAVGVFASFQDLLTGGAFPGVRDARETNLAAFFHEEFEVGRYRLQVGARYDWHRVEPVDTSPIATGDGFVPVETRTFGDVSGSVAGLVDLGRGWTLGVSAARAFRSPSVKELFSAGPHLADFSYDIGNPELGTEVGLGNDLFLRFNRSWVNLEATVFRNRIRNFIHSRPTGRIDPRFRRFPLYVADGADARFQGADGRVEVEVLSGLVLDVTVSHVRAEYRESGEPLPMIPPTSGAVGIRYEVRSYFLNAAWDGAAAQERVPRPIPNPTAGEPDILPERPTEGHHIFSVGAGLRWFRGEQAHALTLGVENLFDTTWWDHLSRAKDVAPEPGRNVQLLYRISF